MHGIIPSFPIQLEGKTMCVKVEMVDVPLDYNLLLGRSCTYAMTFVVFVVSQVLCFPHEGRIVIVDQLSIAHADPATSPVSVVPLIENL